MTHGSEEVAAMVMGPTHAMSGAAAGLGMAAVIPASIGGPTTAVGALTFGAVTAGAALLPDIDSPQATVSRAFGFVSVGVAHAAEDAALAVYNLSKGRKDPRRRNGHRTATHTVWFALAAGALVGVLVDAFGKTPTIAVLFLMLGLALRGLFPKWSSSTDWLVVTAVSAAAAVAVWTWQPQTAGAWALGTAVTVGIVAHLLGDALTKSGVPMFGGVLSINGRRWWDVGLPGFLRIKANGSGDKMLLSVFTVLSCCLACLTVFDPAWLGASWPPLTG
ncbi:MAG: metal-dependent hydrolase [Gordonia sp. (in: high G+C Gram-positive bacteria)]|uniref:metal-dependent hydrolase n=1 Tax=Gordonia sp. (in: high G+C Gram-positive bacteria) TaxID=84139 RepID=UPI0039E6B792